MTRSIRSAHTAVRCSITTSVAPVSPSACSMLARTSRTPSGSRFAVGSSSSSTPGRIASTPARARRCFCPPESDFVCRARGTSSPTASSASATRAGMSADRHPEVLAAEGDVVTHLRQHHAGVRILQHQPDAAAVRLRPLAVDEERAGLVALVGAAEEPGHAGEQRRLAGARGAEEQHALPRLDRERDVADGGCPPPGVAPPPARRGDAGRAGRAHRQTSRRASRPAAKRLSAPVAASARTASQPTTPASRAPDTMSDTR